MSHLTRVALLQSLKKALGGAWFNLGGVTDACGILQRPIYVNNLEWNTLKALHCSDWKDLDSRAKVELCETIARVLGIDIEEDYAFVRELGMNLNYPQHLLNA